MEDHDGRDRQGDDVHEVRRALEDDGIGKLDISCVAGRQDPHVPRYPPYQRAEGQRCLATDFIEVSEPHDKYHGRSLFSCYKAQILSALTRDRMRGVLDLE